MTDKSSMKYAVCVGGLLFGCLIAFIAGASIDFRPSTWWLLILFLLPLAVQAKGLWTLYQKYEARESRKVFSWFYLVTMSICLPSYCLLWCFYSVWEHRFHWLDRANAAAQYAEMLNQWGGATARLTFLSGAALAAIVALLILVVKMAQAIIDGDIIKDGEQSARQGWKWTNLDYLRTGASEEPFLSLVFFLTVFLGVSYLFGFALAFSDKSYPPDRPALFMGNTSFIPPASPSPAPNPARPAKLYAFKFSRGLAMVPLPDAAPPVFQTARPGGRPVKTDEDVQREAEWKEAVTPNATETGSVVRDIISWTEARNPVRVVLTGYSDKTSLSGNSYQSNYELAEARALNAKQVLLSKLSESGSGAWRDIEWVCLSASNEQSNSEKAVQVRLESAVGNSSYMLLRGQHPVSLGLMDYIYFANYTITTTGYGDIMPQTTYAKFLCSLANICEIFFLVVLFNALLSLKDNKKEEASSQSLVGRLVEAIKGDKGLRVLSEEEWGKIKGAVEGKRDGHVVTEEQLREALRQSDESHKREVQNNINNLVAGLETRVQKSAAHKILDALEEEDPFSRVRKKHYQRMRKNIDEG